MKDPVLPLRKQDFAMMTLVPCPSCARHVRAGEGACPFCSSALPVDLAARAVPAATRRLSRVAAFGFAAAVAALGTASTTGCAADSDGSEAATDEDDITKKKCCDPSKKPNGGIEGVWCCGDGTWQYDIGNGDQLMACKGHRKAGTVCKAKGCAANTTQAKCESDPDDNCSWTIKASGGGSTDPGSPVAMYGMPPVEQLEYECTDVGSPMPMYGMPPAGPDGGGFAPMYGMPPPNE
jgi:hypothetical protein